MAQQEELGLQSEPVKWQHMGPTAPTNVSLDVAEMEFCLIERVSYQANSPDQVGCHTLLTVWTFAIPLSCICSVRCLLVRRMFWIGNYSRTRLPSGQSVPS